MAILIVGGLGHVGSWITHDLAERGEDLIVFDANARAFDTLGLDYLQKHRGRFRLDEVDILDTHSLLERMHALNGQIEAVVFGVAVIAGPGFAERPFRHIEINTMGMLNVIEACRIFGIPKFINMSSGAVYGNAPGGQTEQTPYKATDLYCATKISNEVLALQYGETYGIDVRNARLMAVYGPGRMPSAMHALYQVLFGPLEGMRDISADHGADQAMDWTHVRDTAQGVIAVLDSDGVAGESFNISSGVATTHKTLMALVENILGEPTGAHLGPGSFLDRGAPLDGGKARRVLGFAPRFADIRDGLVDYHRWIAAAQSARAA